MHPDVITFVHHAMKCHGPWRRIVEYASRDVNGSPRGLFPRAQYIGVDPAAGPGVDVVADAAVYRPPWPPDAILCLEVLEHAPNWRLILANAHATIAQRGVLVVTCATDPRPSHSSEGGPVRPSEHYANISPKELFEQVRLRWKEISITVRPTGDLQLTARYPIR